MESLPNGSRFLRVTERPLGWGSDLSWKEVQLPMAKTGIDANRSVGLRLWEK